VSLPVVLIAAVARNGVIGAGNRLPWRISSDLKRFRDLTWGRPMVMGRKTFQSIGKPLPGRETIVVSGAGFAAEGVEVAPDVASALALAGARARAMGADSVAVVGGGAVYEATMAAADRLEITEVDAEVEGDVRFPAIAPRIWVETARSRGVPGARDDHAYAFVTYTRRAATPSRR